MWRYRVSGPDNRVFTTTKRAPRPSGTLLAVCCCLLVAGAQQSHAAVQPPILPRPNINPKDVVRQVCAVRSSSSADGRERPSDSSEFLVDTSITRVPAQFGQSLPAVASDGANFLVVWQDDRYGIISGARVTPQGALLEPAGIVITPVPGDRGAPAVGFDGVNFLVIWEEDRVGTDWDIYGTRVSPQGAVLDPSGIPISTAADDQLLSALAFDGTNYCVVWEDDRDDTLYNIYGARVTPQGEVLDTAGIPISTAENDQLTPAVAFDGAGFFVAWEDYRTTVSDIYGARVTSEGSVFDTAGIPISTATNVQLLPALGYDGENLLVTWGDFRSQNSLDIYGARVTPQGAVLDPAGLVISQAVDNQDFPAAGFDGENFFVAWGDLRNGTGWDIYGARVTPQGAVLDPAGLVISSSALDQYYPAIGYDGDNFLLAWEDDRGGSGYDIYSGRVTPEGEALDPAGFLVSQSANDQNSPAAGFDGENFLVAWADDRKGSGWDIYGARVTSEGEVLDPTGFVISEAAKDQRLPAVSFDGTNFLLAWEDHRSDPAGDIYGARVTPEGEVLDPAGFVISQAVNDQNLPAVTFDGTNSLVVWADYRDSTRFHIYGARVTPEGAVLEPSGITITTVPGVQYAPAVAFDGANHLVVWQDTRSGTDWDIYGTRVSPQGEVLNPAGVALSQAEHNQRFPAAAFDGTSFLVAWQDNRYGSDYDIFGARATPQGSVLDPSGIPISTAAEDQLPPALGFDGASFLVVWEDYRNGIDYDIFGARVSPQGTVSDSGSVVSEPQDQTLPRLGVGSGGRILLVYEGWAANVGGKDYNANRIWGEINPRPSNRKAVIAKEITTGRATIVRGLLHMPVRPGPKWLLDVSGRKVLELLPGANDVRALAPGVYFVVELGTKNQELRTKTKVVVAR
jgi:phosphoribosylformylglycinamidine (FGAM) synthase PurS component